MAKAQPATIAVSLDEMEASLQTLQKERVRIEEQLSKVQSQLNAHADNARELKKKLAAGDGRASDALDRIDAECKNLLRAEEGLRLSEQQLSPQIVSLQALVNETRRIRQDEEKSHQFDEACFAATRATEKFLALYAEITKAAGELSIASANLVRWGQEGCAAWERLVLKPTLNPGHALDMCGWEAPLNGSNGRDFIVRGKLPPAVNGNGHHK